MGDVFEELKRLFMSFPGIGRRQAERFVYFLLKQDDSYVEDLAARITELKQSIQNCTRCKRFFIQSAGTEHTQCSICSDKARDSSSLLVVAQDVDIKSIEESGSYKGLYFVLGGMVPALDVAPASSIRIGVLKELLAKEKPKEVILALNTNPEGENTREYVIKALTPLQKKYGFTISSLGRGLATGAELEYADPETIKNALSGRG